MKDKSGVPIRLGDQVRICKVDTGTVVVAADENAYDPRFPRSEWAEMATGILVETARGALVHLQKTADVEVMRETGPPSPSLSPTDD